MLDLSRSRHPGSKVVAGTLVKARSYIAAILNMTTCQGRGSQNSPLLVLGSHTRPGNGTF